MRLFGGRKGKRLIEKAKGHTMDMILVFCAVCLIVYTVINLYMFYQFQQEPSTLTTCVYAALTGECGIMGWIKTTKLKHQQTQEHPEQVNEESPPHDNIDDSVG